MEIKVFSSCKGALLVYTLIVSDRVIIISRNKVCVITFGSGLHSAIVHLLCYATIVF
jgi:hypothetical protein